MKNFLVNKLVWFSQQKRTLWYKVVSTTLGAFLVAVLLPVLLIFLARPLERFFQIHWSINFSLIVAVVSITFGLFFILWAIIAQYKIGRGSPAHNAPTQNLVIVGPYKLCRNPMQFGGMFWYFGVGTLAGSPITGIFCALAEFVLGTFYHKLIEEKELERRFGVSYLEYKKRVPFLIPWSKKL